MRGLHWLKLSRLERGEKLGLGLLLLFLGMIIGGIIRWGADSQLVIWIFLWLAGICLVLRRLWIGLFGPVFSFDLVRTSRRSPIFSLRCLYAGALLFILYLFYVSWFGNQLAWPWESDRELRLPIDRQAAFARSFFLAYLGVQVSAVLLITPLAVSSAIAEEKEKKTLGFLLATDLRDHEIVIGKLASRLVHLFLFLLTGLPILTLLQFMGGIDPNLVLATFCSNLLMTLGLASVSILCSVNAEKPLSAMISSYLGAAAYCLINCVCASPVFVVATAWSGGGGALEDFESHSSLLMLLLSLLMNGFVAFVCCKAAIKNLRRRFRLHQPSTRELLLDDIPDRPQPPSAPKKPAVQAAQKEEPPRERELTEYRRTRQRFRDHPPMGADPMLWKEKYIDQGLGLPESLRALGQIPLIMGIVLLTYFVIVCGLQSMLNLDRAVGPGAYEFTNGVVRVAGTGVLCFMLFGVALRTAHSISSERDRRTLDSLLTTPLENREILLAKWWSSLLYVRKGWWFLGLIWFLGLFTLGLHILAIPLLIFGWFMYAVFAAGLGLFFSLVASSSLKATLGTFFLLIGAAFAPIALWWVLESLLLVTGLHYQFTWLLDFEAELLSPPVALVKVAVLGKYDGPAVPLVGYRLGVILLGMYLYGLLGAALWTICLGRFSMITQRMPYGTPPATRQPLDSVSP